MSTIVEYRTANLQICILYTYSTNTGTEYFKHGIYFPFFSSKCSLFHNSNIFGSCIIHNLYTECAKIKKNNSGAKSSTRLTLLGPVTYVEPSDTGMYARCEALMWNM